MRSNVVATRALVVLAAFAGVACGPIGGTASGDQTDTDSQSASHGGGGAGGTATQAAGAGSGGTAGSAGSVGNGGQAGNAQAGSSGSGGSAASGGSAGSSGSGGGGGTGGSSGSGGAAGGGAVTHVPRLGTALKILPFGDSITASTCYRADLAELLDAAHEGDYDFVGTQNGDYSCGATYDMDHEGHGGYLVTQHTGEFAGWASSNPADVVLLHFATNDVWNGVPTETILAAYGQAVDAFRANNENVTILVAKIIPFAPDGCDHCNVEPLNTAIPGWAASKATAKSPIVVVDQFTGYSATDDNRDKVHPNDSGSLKMATKWAAALNPLF